MLSIVCFAAKSVVWFGVVVGCKTAGGTDLFLILVAWRWDSNYRTARCVRCVMFGERDAWLLMVAA